MHILALISVSCVSLPCSVVCGLAWRRSANDNHMRGGSQQLVVTSLEKAFITSAVMNLKGGIMVRGPSSNDHLAHDSLVAPTVARTNAPVHSSLSLMTGPIAIKLPGGVKMQVDLPGVAQSTERTTFSGPAPADRPEEQPPASLSIKEES